MLVGDRGLRTEMALNGAGHLELKKFEVPSTRVDEFDKVKS